MNKRLVVTQLESLSNLIIIVFIYPRFEEEKLPVFWKSHSFINFMRHQGFFFRLQKLDVVVRKTPLKLRA